MDKIRVEDRTDNIDSQNLLQRNRYLMAVVADLQATVTTLIAENNALRALMSRLLVNLKNKNLYKQTAKLLERRKEMSHNGITIP